MTNNQHGTCFELEQWSSEPHQVAATFIFSDFHAILFVFIAMLLNVIKSLCGKVENCQKIMNLLNINNIFVFLFKFSQILLNSQKLFLNC